MKASGTRVTLRSLARELDVHVSTVSRVLNGTDDDAKSAASPETVDRIRQLAASLNYRPNLHAISLRTQKTRSVGVVVPQLSDLVLATIYEGMDAAASDNGYLASVSNSLDRPERQRQLGELSLQRRVEGLIFADARGDSPAFIDHLAGQGVPIVLASRHLGNRHCSVTCDDMLGGRMAAEHLLAQGHRRIGLLAAQPYATTGSDRTAAFVSACREAGVDMPPDQIEHGPFDTASGWAAASALLTRHKDLTAIFAVNDFLAIGAMGAARDHGREVGVDIAIVGFNDTPIAAHLPIGLTSVASPMARIGYRSMELLLQMIGGQRPDSEKLAPNLVVRGSSLYMQGH